MTSLFVFDMDGTLLPGSTASLELAAALDALDDLHALEAGFLAGDLDTRGFAAAVHDLFGGLRAEQVGARLRRLPTAGPRRGRVRRHPGAAASARS